MPSNIEQTIEALQKESTYLFEQMQLCSQAGFFLEAHHFQQAYFNVNQTLLALKKLNDPNYDRKKRLERYEKMDFEKFKLENETRPEALRIPTDQLELRFEIMQKMHQRMIARYPEKPIHPNEDQQYIDEAIFDLLENNISSFKFHLDIKKNWFISFCKKENKWLEIAFTPLIQMNHPAAS